MSGLEAKCNNHVHHTKWILDSEVDPEVDPEVDLETNLETNRENSRTWYGLAGQGWAEE